MNLYSPEKLKKKQVMLRNNTRFN